MWKYYQQPITALDQLPNCDNLTGFVYKITNNLTGAIYIGKKSFFGTRKKPLAKALISADKRKKTYSRVTKESDWMKYWSSSKELQADVKEFGQENFSREILQLSCSKKYLSYLELKYMFEYDVLVKLSYNGNISGTFYRKDIEPCKSWLEKTE
jgi:hypothetical protein